MTSSERINRSIFLGDDIINWETDICFQKDDIALETDWTFLGKTDINHKKRGETDKNFQERETDIQFLISLGEQIKILTLKIVETDQIF